MGSAICKAHTSPWNSFRANGLRDHEPREASAAPDPRARHCR